MAQPLHIQAVARGPRHLWSVRAPEWPSGVSSNKEFEEMVEQGLRESLQDRQSCEW